MTQTISKLLFPILLIINFSLMTKSYSFEAIDQIICHFDFSWNSPYAERFVIFVYKDGEHKSANIYLKQDNLRIGGVPDILLKHYTGSDVIYKEDKKQKTTTLTLMSYSKKELDIVLHEPSTRPHSPVEIYGEYQYSRADRFTSFRWCDYYPNRD